MAKRLFVAVFLIAGCASAGGKSGSVDGNLGPQEYVCDSGPSVIETVSDWSECLRATASKTYLYAQLAHNAYKPQKDALRRIPYQFPSYVDELEALYGAEGYPLNDKGFQYRIYSIRWQDGRPEERVISFRGTDDVIDRWFGNPFKTQNGKAVELYDQLDADFDGPISVVGDSLGGALATYVSLCRDVKLRVALNTSPRTGWFCPGGRRQTPVDIDRSFSIAERGEILEAIRFRVLQDYSQLYTKLDCYPRSRGRFWRLTAKEHADGTMIVSRCLTRIAAIDDPGARASIELNPNIFTGHSDDLITDMDKLFVCDSKVVDSRNNRCVKNSD